MSRTTPNPDPRVITQPPLSEGLKRILQFPLIVGASVSANHRGIASPGRQLALRTTSSANILTLAKSGKSAVEVLRELRAPLLTGRTSVIAIDLLFWDSTRPNPEPSLNAFAKFCAEVVAEQLPIVLGEIPGFFPPMQPTRQILNQAIQAFARSYEPCLLFPFASIYEQIVAEGVLRHTTGSYGLAELLPDGLHLSKLAGQVIADLIQTQWEAKLTKLNTNSRKKINLPNDLLLRK